MDKVRTSLTQVFDVASGNPGRRGATAARWTAQRGWALAPRAWINAPVLWGAKKGLSSELRGGMPTWEASVPDRLEGKPSQIWGR